VRRFAGRWRREQRGAGGTALVPLVVPPGDAYQFDGSHELALLGGLPVTVKVAHARAFAFFGGACRRGICDTMSTAVDAVFLGKDRVFNRRFLQLCSHDLVEPPPVPPAPAASRFRRPQPRAFVRKRAPAAR
jgi:hypothetical protein